MLIPSEMTTGAYLRVIRRWTIAVAVFYAVAVVTLVLVATVHQPSLSIEGRIDAAMSQPD